MEMEERGYGSVPDRYVCKTLFPHQQEIIDYIAENGILGQCSYSHRHTRVIALEDVVVLVLEKLKEYFDDPAAECGFESHDDPNDDWSGTGFHKEGSGYIVPDNHSILDTREAMLFLNIESSSESLNSDIINCINQNNWILIDPYEDTPAEIMYSGWREFVKKTVKDARDGCKYSDIYSKYSATLIPIADAVRSNLDELSRNIKSGNYIYRCVAYPQLLDVVHDYNLWAPPASKASSQRMSRQGQSRLYVSFDKKTPLQEAVSNGGKEIKYLGTFQTLCSFNVLDLSHLPYPSAFNVNDFFVYQFLWHFADAITQPIEDDKTYYVPTQIMRDVFESSLSNYGIMGIVYRSSKVGNHDNMVLFLDEHTCAKYVRLVSHEIF